MRWSAWVVAAEVRTTSIERPRISWPLILERRVLLLLTGSGESGKNSRWEAFVVSMRGNQKQIQKTNVETTAPWTNYAISRRGGGHGQGVVSSKRWQKKTPLREKTSVPISIYLKPSH